MGVQRTRTAPERERRRTASRPAVAPSEVLHGSPADHLGALQRPPGGGSAPARTTAALGLQAVVGNLAVQRAVTAPEAPSSIETATTVTPPAASIAPIMGTAPDMTPTGTLQAAPSSVETAARVAPPEPAIAPIMGTAPDMTPTGTLQAAPSSLDTAVTVTPPAASIAPIVHPAASVEQSLVVGAPAASVAPVVNAAPGADVSVAHPAPVATPSVVHAPPPLARAGTAPGAASPAAAHTPAAPVAHAGAAHGAAPAEDGLVSDSTMDMVNSTLDTTSNIGGVVDAGLQNPSDPNAMADLGHHGAVGTSPFGLLNAVQNARQGFNTLGAGGSDIAGGYRSGDWQRGAEGVGRLVEGTAGVGSAGISAVGSVTSMVQAGAVNSGSAMGQAGSALSNTAQVLGTLGAGASVVTGGIGLLKSGAQGIAAHRRVNRLEEMGAAEQTRATAAGATPAEVAAAQQRQALIAYAAETQRKRRNRAGINATANTAQVVGGALTLSGVGAAAGAGLALAGSGLKLGAAAARGVKQRLRDYYAERDAAGHQRGWFGNLFSRTKTTANKNAEREQRAQQLIAGGAANVPILEQIGGNAEDVALLTNASRSPEETAKLTKSITDLFKKRE